MDKEGAVAPPDPAAAVLARLGEQQEICGSEPPPSRGWGDCWCTLPPEHPEELCLCEPCHLRFGLPGWRAER